MQPLVSFSDQICGDVSSPTYGGSIKLYRKISQEIGDAEFFAANDLNSQYAVFMVKINHEETVFTAKRFSANHLAATETDISSRGLRVDFDQGRAG